MISLQLWEETENFSPLTELGQHSLGGKEVIQNVKSKLRHLRRKSNPCSVFSIHYKNNSHWMQL